MATNPLHNPERAIRDLAKKWRGGALQRPMWSIIDWSVHFENSHTRKLARLPFVLVPTKHDGKGFNRLMRGKHEKKAVIFACFILIIELAAKSPARGYLADEDGPYTFEDMSDMTGISSADFELALSVLTSEEINWLEKLSPESIKSSPDSLPQSPDSLPQSPDSLPQSPDSLPSSPESSPNINDLQNSGDTREKSGDTREKSGAREEKRREEKKREEYPYRPQGDNELVSSETKSAEKKEGGRSKAAIAAESGARILAMFPGAGALAPVSFGHLLEHVETGVLPADEKKWRALAVMRAERAEIQGTPEDYDLRAAWLISKERLCRDLAEALETALAKRPQHAASALEAEKHADTAPAPEKWQESLAALYPMARVPSDFYELPADIRDEIAAKGAA